MTFRVHSKPTTPEREPEGLPLARPNQDQREWKPLMKFSMQFTRVGSQGSEQGIRGDGGGSEEAKGRQRTYT